MQDFVPNVILKHGIAVYKIKMPITSLVHYQVTIWPLRESPKQPPFPPPSL